MSYRITWKYTLIFWMLLMAGSPVARAQDDSYSDTGPSWSPDGNQIGFSSDRSGQFELYVMSADGNDLTQLTRAEGDDHYVSWSPDGQLITFISDRTGENFLYVMDSDGGNVRSLAEVKLVARPVWSPDGAFIYFSVMVRGDTKVFNPAEMDIDVFRIRPDGTQMSNLTETPGLDSSALISPDGTTVLFASSRGLDSPMARNLYRMRPDGTGQELVAGDFNSSLQSWSPDGSKITVVTRRTGNPEIFLMRPDGTFLNNLTSDPGADFYAEWSPDGSRILFSSSRAGSQALYVVNADGSGLQQLTYNR